MCRAGSLPAQSCLLVIRGPLLRQWWRHGIHFVLRCCEHDPASHDIARCLMSYEYCRLLQYPLDLPIRERKPGDSFESEPQKPLGPALQSVRQGGMATVTHPRRAVIAPRQRGDPGRLGAWAQVGKVDPRQLPYQLVPPRNAALASIGAGLRQLQHLEQRNPIRLDQRLTGLEATADLRELEGSLHQCVARWARVSGTRCAGPRCGSAHAAATTGSSDHRTGSPPHGQGGSDARED